MKIIEADKLTKTYGDNTNNTTNAVNDISIGIEEGDFTAIMGPSGSGKSTLITMLSGIQKPTAGEVIIDGVPLSKLNKSDMAAFRRQKLGFVFQDFNLLDNLTIKENIILPMVLDNRQNDEMNAVSEKYMKQFGIFECRDKFPYEISGGQMQRAAIGRSLVNDPVILFADEPTGNLDSKSSNVVMKCFENINNNMKTTILMVTHDVFAASFCRHVVFIKDGKVNIDIIRKGSRQEFFDQILDCQAVVGGDSDDI